jgi:hypothetical protein
VAERAAPARSHRGEPVSRESRISCTTSAASSTTTDPNIVFTDIRSLSVESIDETGRNARRVAGVWTTQFTLARRGNPRQSARMNSSCAASGTPLGPALATALVVDVANVMGSRPDGWWRDRAGAASRLVGEIAALRGRRLDDPHGVPILVVRLVTVVEGQARGIPDVAGVEMMRASADGDDDVFAACVELLAAGARPLAITADRQLRRRLPVGTEIAGPGWLLGLLGSAEPGEPGQRGE